MAVFTVHVPPEVADPVRKAERTLFVRDGFSLAAFLFGLVYLLYRRLWLAALAYAAAALALGTLAHLLTLGPGGTALFALALALITGLEANDLRRWSLDRRGFAFAAVVAGPDREACERRYFGGETQRTTPPPPPPPGAPRRPVPPVPQVIGFFPDSGARA